MKNFKGWHPYVTMILAIGQALFMVTGPASGAEPDEEKLLNRLKGKLAEEDSTMGKLLDRLSFGLLIEAGAFYRDENEEGEDESDIALTTVELGIEALINPNVAKAGGLQSQGV